MDRRKYLKRLGNAVSAGHIADACKQKRNPESQSTETRSPPEEKAHDDSVKNVKKFYS
jgi:hypothetical protein